MSIQGKLARVIEANRISGVKAYGDVEYREVDPRMEMWKLEEVSADVVVDITWVKGFDQFVGELVHGRGYGQGK